MKVSKSGGVSRAYGVTTVGGVRRVAPASGALAVDAVAPVSATVMGIPESEFTPRVRDAIMTLMGEVDRLRQEIDHARSRLEEMALAADQDMLLPVLNRRAFVREITRFIAFAERYGTPSSLLYFDLDDFKIVNDTHGHSAGDAALKHFADTLGKHVRETDVVARLGGDEFGVILAHVGLEQAGRKGEQLAEALHESPSVWDGQKIALQFSFGAYELKAGESADSAMANADKAMYQHKRAER
jgi:diguanylate cyclase (GGDEF)-like protein